MKAHRIAPAPGQESVWDYPRPPRVEESAKHVQVVFGGLVIADTCRAMRVLETSHPPVYYIAPNDIETRYLHDVAARSSYCEWKGEAAYLTIIVGDKKAQEAAWVYRNPTPAFRSLKDYVAFYPGMMEACFVDSERVVSQPGDFYGGWITKDIVGPFKGAPGTWGW